MKHKQKTILICSNYAWTIFNFRLPIIRSLRNAGYRVEVATQFDGYEARLVDEVDNIHNLFISRKGLNPIVDLITCLNILLIVLKSKIDICLLFTIKPVIYGSIAASFIRVPALPMITGLGTAFLTDGILASIVKSLYKVALRPVKIVFFQNTADKNLFINEGIVDKKFCRLSPGSGVDLDKFSPSDPPLRDQLTFLLVARMLWDKGIGEFIEAARLIKLKHPKTRFQLLGPLGVQNRSSISNKDMTGWLEEDIIEYLGETDNVDRYIKDSCCVVLPSYREGTSRVLLEAAAMSRPVIATDVPGCREVIEDDITGFLCKPRDYNDLSDKMEKMILLPYETRRIMGEKGRQKVQQEFCQNIVCKLYIDTIEECFSGS